MVIPWFSHGFPLDPAQILSGVGRTGRAGATGEAFTLVSKEAQSISDLYIIR